MSQQEPEGKARELEYARPEVPKTARLLMGIFGGIFGYLGLMAVMYVVCALALPSDVPGWVLFGAMVVVPLGVMVAAAVLLKSRAMMVSVLITFGVMALTCGTCMVLLMH